MRERPILFSGPMVRALLAGQKTQTRRLASTSPCGKTIRPLGGHVQPLRDGSWEWSRDGGFDQGVLALRCPHGGPGDRLWVRETWAGDDLSGFVYRADHPTADLRRGDLDDGEQSIRQWHPSIFMRRGASRVTLEIVNVRVERLRSITEADIAAEGVTRESVEGLLGRPVSEPLGASPVGLWSLGWDAINGKRAPWSTDPWVWALGFRVLS